MAKTLQKQGVFEVDPKAERVGIRISILITKGNFLACHEIIDQLDKEEHERTEEKTFIHELDLNERTVDLLDKAGYLYIYELTEEVLSTIQKINCLGRRREAEIRAALEKYQEEKYEPQGQDDESIGSTEAG